MPLMKVDSVKFKPELCSKFFIYGNTGINLLKKITDCLNELSVLVISPHATQAELIGVKSDAIWLYCDIDDVNLAIEEAYKDEYRGKFDVIVLNDITTMNQMIYNYIITTNSETMGLKGDLNKPRLEAADWSVLAAMTRDRINAFEKACKMYIVLAREITLQNAAGDVIGIAPNMIGSLREQITPDFPEIIRASSNRASGETEIIYRTNPTVGITAKDVSGRLSEIEKSFTSVVEKLEIFGKVKT